MTLQTQDLETTKAGKFGWFAQQDALRRNENNKSRYTPAQRRTAVTMLDLLDNVYSYTESFINYRTKFIVIKLSDARVKNRAMLRDVEQILEEKHAEKVVTPQGVIYHIPKI